MNKLQEMKQKTKEFQQSQQSNSHESQNTTIHFTNEELHEMKVKEQIYNFAKEELEFYEVAKSMKNINIEHSNSFDKNIKLENDNDFLISNKDLMSITAPLGMSSKNLGMGGSQNKAKVQLGQGTKQDIQMQQYLDNVKVYNKKKEKLEKLVKQKTNGMKYIDMEAYKKAKLNRILVTFSILVLFIVGVFATYSYYKTSLNSTK